MQRIMEKQTPTRLKFWLCGFLYCNLPLAGAERVSGVAVSAC